jgi:hypothetical protein
VTIRVFVSVETSSRVKVHLGRLEEGSDEAECWKVDIFRDLTADHQQSFINAEIAETEQ